MINLLPKFFGRKNISSSRKPKIGQKFLFPDGISPFEKFSFLSFWSVFFKNFDFGSGWRAEIFGVLSEIFFGQKNMYFLAKNQKSARNFYFRLKFGQLKKIKFDILGLFFKNFDFGAGRRAEISGVLSENLFGQQNIYFLVGEQKSARNFNLQPNFGHFAYF